MAQSHARTVPLVYDLGRVRIGGVWRGLRTHGYTPFSSDAATILRAVSTTSCSIAANPSAIARAATALGVVAGAFAARALQRTAKAAGTWTVNLVSVVDLDLRPSMQATISINDKTSTISMFCTFARAKDYVSKSIANSMLGASMQILENSAAGEIRAETDRDLVRERVVAADRALTQAEGTAKERRIELGRALIEARKLFPKRGTKESGWTAFLDELKITPQRASEAISEAKSADQPNPPAALPPGSGHKSKTPSLQPTRKGIGTTDRRSLADVVSTAIATTLATDDPTVLGDEIAKQLAEWSEESREAAAKVVAAALRYALTCIPPVQE